MIISTQVQDGVVVLNVLGQLGIETHLTLKKKVRDLIDDGEKKILIDVSGLRAIDSTGIGTLVALLNTARARHGDVRLAGSFESSVEDIFRLCGLQRVFSLYDDIETGVREFSA